MQDELTADLASQFVKLALANLTREFPNKLDHIMADATDVKTPRALHPIFYGSFDWHSCVHGYWLLARILRSFPNLPELRAIRLLVEKHFTGENVKVELDY